MKTSTASTALALILGLGLGASLPAGATQHMLDYDTNNDGIIDAEEANLYAEREFENMTADEDYLTEEQFGEMYGGDDDPEVMFGEIDEDADDQISQEEWVTWRDREFTEATEETEGEMPNMEFEEWLGADITGTRSPAERSP